MLSAAEKSALERYEKYAIDASTCVRALALGVLAAGWLFLSDATGLSPVKSLHRANDFPLLEWALVCSLAALGFDLMQYALGAYHAQRFADLISTVLDPRNVASNHPRVDRAWKRAAACGVVEEILESAGELRPNLRADANAAIEKCRKVIKGLYAAEQSASETGHAIDSKYLRVRRIVLDSEITTTTLVRATRWMFWLKILSVLGASGLLIAFFGTDLLA